MKGLCPRSQHKECAPVAIHERSASVATESSDMTVSTVVEMNSD